MVDEVNKRQKMRIVQKIVAEFGDDLAGRHFAIWGLAFKPNTDDMREAPAITVINSLIEKGATVSAYDPAAMESSKFYFGDRITYATNDYDALENADALLILTEWNEFRNPEFSKLRETLKEPVIFDGRNIYDPAEMPGHGLRYHSIGRATV